LLNSTGRMFILEAQSPAEILSYLTGQALPARRILGAAPPTQMKLSDWLSPSDMLPAITGSTPETVIREMLAHLATYYPIGNTDQIAADIMSREQQMPTVMGDGTALPHVRTSQAHQLLCVVGRSSAGIDFNGDGTPETHLIFLVIAPENATKPYMQFVAALFRHLHGQTRESLLAANTPAGMWNALCNDPKPAGANTNRTN